MGILPWDACQLQSLPSTLLGMCCTISVTVQNKLQVSYTYHEMSVTITKCQVKVSFLEMLGTYPIAGI